MKRLKLAVNAGALLAPTTGVGQYVQHLMQEVVKFDEIDARFFYAKAWSEAVGPPPNAVWRGARRLRTSLGPILPNAYLLSRWYQQLNFWRGTRRTSFDLYHEPNFVPFRFNGPTVVTIHDLSFMEYPDSHPKDRVSALNKYVPWAVNNAEHVIVDSEFIRREVISAFAISEAKVSAVHLGVSDRFYPREAAGCAPWLSTQELSYRGYVLAVGTIEPRKNVLGLIQAYAALPQKIRARFPLVIAGMKGWRDAEINARLKGIRGQLDVRVLGYVESAMLPILYAGARVLAYPSIYEGFGLPPLEAMASRTPVIAADRSSIPEVVGSAAILVDPYDTAAISEQLRRLLEDDDAANKFAEAGLERAKRFTWKLCAARTVEIYKQCVGTSAGMRRQGVS